VYETVNMEALRQRHDEMLREAELDRLTMALRASRKKTDVSPLTITTKGEPARVMGLVRKVFATKSAGNDGDGTTGPGSKVPTTPEEPTPARRTPPDGCKNKKARAAINASGRSARPKVGARSSLCPRGQRLCGGDPRCATPP